MSTPSLFRHTAALVALSAALCACAGSGVAPLSSLPGAGNAAHSIPAATKPWIPTAGESFQIQYDGKLDLDYSAQIFDLDMFDTPASVVAKLHAKGRRVVCYIDVGTWEKYRPDADKFPKWVLGRKDGRWAGERWLDIRATKVLEPIMAARYDLCKKKGFDGIDPDNIDGYQNDTGFPLTAAEQLRYDEWVANASHARGLTVDQKNDNSQLKVLSKFFDFGVDEQCWSQGWCHQLTIYTDRNALVVNVQYGHKNVQEFQEKTCPSDARYNITAILKKIELTAWIVTCKPH
jgi:hypothetical protein